MIDLNSIAFKIASFGRIGQWLTRNLIVTLLAIPALFLLRGIYSLHEPTFYFVILFGAVFSLITIQLAYKHSPESTNMIVLDKFLGILLALTQIPLTIKLVVTAYLLFHVFNVLCPFLVWKIYGKNMHELPGALGIIASDIGAALAVNIIFRFTLWLAN